MNLWIWYVACVPCICWNRDEFIGMEEDDEYYKFYIKKQKDET
jgi:hypothetical protein